MKQLSDYLYYEEPAGKIYCGDCLEIMPLLGNNLVVITDPPYGVNLGNHIAAKESRGRWLNKKGYESYDDTYENFLKYVVPAIQQCTKRFDRVVTFCAGTMMWDLPRPSAVGGVYLPAACGRNCWGFASLSHVLFYGKAPNLEKGSKHIAIKSNDVAEKNGHPCPKPYPWMAWLVNLASRPSETILDPFLGSGTTAVAAKQLDRKFIGIEIEEKYCKVAVQRLAQEVLL